jgi:Uma2 family endonuclease
MVTRITSPALPVLEGEHLWPAQGEWTYEDYLRLPDDGRRYEIIKGVLYVTNAPGYDHQFTVGELHRQLGNFVVEKALGVVMIAPFEILLPGIAQPVQPDVFFFAKDRQPKRGDKNFRGVPDLIIEVSSPATMRRDHSTKLDAYEQAGVREYWLANPYTRSIMIYTLPAEGQEYVLLGEFSASETLHSAVLPGLELAIDTLFTS